MEVTLSSAARRRASDRVRERMGPIVSGAAHGRAPDRSVGGSGDAVSSRASAQMALTFSACGPLGPWVMSNSTR